MKITVRNCLFLLLSSAFFMTACFGDDGYETKQIDDPAVTQTGEATGTSSLGLAGLPPGADEDAAQQVIAMVGNAITAFASQHQAYANSQSSGSSLINRAYALEEEGDAQNGSAQIEYSYENGHLKADIKAESPSGSIHYEADLKINLEGEGETLKSTVDGTLSVVVTSGVDNLSTSVNYHGKYNMLTYDATACGSNPISGSIEVEYDINSLGSNLPGLGSATSGFVKATFGPECGEIEIEGT